MQLQLFLVCIVLEHSVAQELYGASVNWRPTSNASISLSYRFIWEGRDTITSAKANCNAAKIPLAIQLCQEAIDAKFQGGLLSIQDSKIKPPIFLGHNWLCIKGCRTQRQIVTNLSKLYFIDASSFVETHWESGVGSAELTFDNRDNKENIVLGFADQNGALVDGLGEAYLNMAVRNDTNRPNISPLVNVLPIYRVPLGCNINIKLFPFDGDGDRVSCHWQTFPEENSTSSNTLLNSNTCELIFSAARSRFRGGDAISLSLYAEDYSSSLVEFTGASRYITSGPFCRTPIKLRVFVGNSTASCQSDGPQFNPEGTLRPYYKKSYEMDYFINGYPAHLPFMTDNQKTQPDECKASTNPCGKGGICDNFFEHFTCSYPALNVTENMSQSGTCNTGVTTEKGNDGLKIGLPVGLFLLLLLILIAVTLYLKHKWSEKMQTVDVGDETPISNVAKNAFQ